MATARIRFALVSIVLSLVLAVLGSATSSAQTTDDSAAFVDPMDGSSPPLLTEQALDNGQVVQQYVLGQFIIQAFNPDHAGDILSSINTEPLADARTAVDATVDVPEGSEPSVLVGCRAADEHNGYAFRLQQSSGDVSIWRLDAEGPV